LFGREERKLSRLRGKRRRRRRRRKRGGEKEMVAN
jgi:hypothetical protein